MLSKYTSVRQIEAHTPRPVWAACLDPRHHCSARDHVLIYHEYLWRQEDAWLIGCWTWAITWAPFFVLLQKARRAEARRQQKARVRRFLNARRRAKVRNAHVRDLTLDQWENIKRAFAYRCAYCGRDGLYLTQDHVIPISRGGNHTATNVVPACHPCNCRKRDYPAPPFLVVPV